MGDVVEFGRVLLLLAAGAALALFSSKVTEKLPIPAPAIFLVAAAIFSAIFPAARHLLTPHDLVNTVSVALVMILFDGGMSVGYSRFKTSVVPIMNLGVLGTFATTGLIAVTAYYLFGFDWTTAGLIGAALAPTDPAAIFSVFGRRQIVGRSGTILEGESGANDPVGIALILALLEAATTGHGGAGGVVVDFVVEMVVGVVVGLGLAWVMAHALRRISLPSEGLYPIRTLVGALVIYGAATVLHGSGFIAVFVAAIAIGDLDLPHKGSVKSFHSSLASLAEIIAFAAFGLSIDVSDLTSPNIWLNGLLLAVLLAVAIRPVVAGVLLLPVNLSVGERVFIAWGGLKGAVPILLGAFAIVAGVRHATAIYQIVVVVVTFSVLVQGSTMFAVARRVRIPMREVVQEPWEGRSG